MKKILSFFAGLIFTYTTVLAAEKVNIEKQLIGIVGAVSGTIKTETRELKTGDKIYLNETILAGADSGTQILLLDQSTFTIGSESEVVMDTFIYDPATNDGKIVASVKQGSLKVISGLISKKNPDSLTVEVPEGTLGSRGTEFQTIVSKKQTSTLLIGPGKNNTLGLRPGAVLVGNKLGSTLLSNPYSVSTMQKGKAPGQSKKITKSQLKKFNKKMKALKVAKLEGTKDEKKEIRKEIKKDLKAAGLDKEEIKVLIKDNIQKDKEKKIEKEIQREQKKDKKKENKKTTKENNKKNKKVTKENNKKPKDVVRKQTIKKQDGTVIQQVTVINPKTKKFRRLQKITDKDGKVSYKESKGKVKKVKPKKVVKKKKPKKKKAVAKKKTKGNKKKSAAKKKKDNKKKATNKKNNNKKKATNKKNNNKKKPAAKKNPPKKKKSAVKKNPPKKKKSVVKKNPPKKKTNKKKNVQKKKQQKNKNKAKNKRNKNN